MVVSKVGKIEVNWRLKGARELHGWSQKYVADQIGADHYYLSRWERNVITPSPFYRQKLCELFGKNAEELGLLGNNQSIQTDEQHSIVNVGEQLSATVPSESMDGRQICQSIDDPTIPVPGGMSSQGIGRLELLQQLKMRLFAGAGACALHGLPGVGKTTLAALLAQDPEVRERFPGGVLWAGLGPHPNILAHLSRWGMLTGTTVMGREPTYNNVGEWAYALRATIGTRKILLVIDDFWQIEDALAFKVGGPNCVYLATTRFPQLAAQFAGSGGLMVTPLDEQASLELLKRWLPETFQDTQTLRPLIQVAGGLPLALTLMGKYLGLQTFSGQPRRLQRALTYLDDVTARLQLSEPQALLDRSPGLPPGTALSLQTVIGVSAQHLGAQARRVLYALAVFPPKPHDFSEEAALKVCNTQVEILDQLSDAGLLESSGPARYTLHQTIADYARAHLIETDSYKRLAGYFAAYSEQHMHDFAVLQQEGETLLVAMQVAFEYRYYDELVRGVCSLIPYLRSQGLFIKAEQLLKWALTGIVEIHAPAEHAMLLLHLGSIQHVQGQLQSAEHTLQEALTVARSIYPTDLDEKTIDVLHMLGSVAHDRGDYTQAEAYMKSSLALAQQLGQTDRACLLFKDLGVITSEQHKDDEARGYFQEGIALARLKGHSDRLCILLSKLGVMEIIRKNYASAETYLVEGRELARQRQHHESFCILSVNLGVNLIHREQFERAEQCLKEGLQVARRYGFKVRQAALLGNLVEAFMSQGRYDEAENAAREGIALLRITGNKHNLCNILASLAECYAKQQRFAEAETTLREARSEAPLGQVSLVGYLAYTESRVAAWRGDTAEALRLCQESVTLLESIGHFNAQEAREWLAALSAVPDASH